MAIAATDVGTPVADRGNLTLLMGSGPCEPETMFLDMHRIIILDQVRKTYTDIERLANSIAVSGMFHPLLVARLTPAEAMEYLETVNLVFKADCRLDEVVPFQGTPEFYDILISGHRRNKAHMHLWFHGCKECVDEYGIEAPGTCYGRHPRLQKGVKAEVYVHIDPLDALSMQCSENIHEQVPSHEQADAYEQLFVIESLQDPALTLTQFARNKGCDPGTIRRAWRYCQLPLGIRQDVEEQRLSYGVALELGRLSERLKLDEATLASERDRVVTERPTVKQLRKYVDDLIQNGSSAMFGIGTLVSAEQTRRRQVFEQEAVRALHGYNAYLRRVQPLLADGTMGPRGKYLDTSARRLLMDNVELLEAILPDLRLRLADAERATQVVAEARQLVEAIEVLEVDTALAD